jgi:hypothetical protein
VRYRVDLKDCSDNALKPVIRVNFADPTGFNDNEFGVSATTRDGDDTPSFLFVCPYSDFEKRDHPLRGKLTVAFP